MDPELQKKFALLFVFLLFTGPTCASEENLKDVATRFASRGIAIGKSIASRGIAIGKAFFKGYKAVKIATWIWNLAMEKPKDMDIKAWMYENPPPIFEILDLLLDFIGVGKAISMGYEVTKNVCWSYRFAAFMTKEPNLNDVLAWLVQNPPPWLVSLVKKYFTDDEAKADETKADEALKILTVDLKNVDVGKLSIAF